MGLRPTDRRRSASIGTSGCALRVIALVARCRLRHGHEWDVVAVSTPLPALGLPAQYRLVCRACGESGGPTFPERAGRDVRPPVVVRAVRPPAATGEVRRSAVAELLPVG